MGDTEAPTSAATTNQLEKEQRVLDKDAVEFVSVIAQYYALTGRLVDEGEAERELYYTPAEYEGFMNNPLVKAALVERGVITRELDSPTEGASPNNSLNLPVGRSKAVVTNGLKRRAENLTPKQLLVANTLLDTIDTRSEKKKLQDLRVSTATYQAWLNDPIFVDYITKRAELLLGPAQADAHLALIDKVKAGDVSAIKYYNDLVGRFSPTSSNGVNVNVGVSGSRSDFKALLFHILEIIQDEVDDPKAKIRIGERFKDLINKQSVAEALLGETEPIEIPKVAQARKLTPELQTLLERGDGYE